MIDYFEYIDDYKAGKLSEQLKADFEAALSIDKKLKYAVDHYDNIKELAGGFIEDETRTILQGLDRSNITTNSKKSNKKNT